MGKELIIEIPLKGISSGAAKITAEAHGIKGEGCLEETRKIMKSVADEEDVSKSFEYYQEETSSVQTSY